MSALVTRLPTRRRIVTTSMAAALSGLSGIGRPYLSRAADRPVVSHGVQSGDISNNSGVVWARADRPARMLVEWSTTESFKSVRSRSRAAVASGNLCALRAAPAAKGRLRA